MCVSVHMSAFELLDCVVMSAYTILLHNPIVEKIPKTTKKTSFTFPVALFCLHLVYNSCVPRDLLTLGEPNLSDLWSQRNAHVYTPTCTCTCYSVHVLDSSCLWIIDEWIILLPLLILCKLYVWLIVIGHHVMAALSSQTHTGEEDCISKCLCRLRHFKSSQQKLAFFMSLNKTLWYKRPVVPQAEGLCPFQSNWNMSSLLLLK